MKACLVEHWRPKSADMLSIVVPFEPISDLKQLLAATFHCTEIESPQAYLSELVTK
jgi:hypothetical protein